jgi:hypothetical protein
MSRWRTGYTDSEKTFDELQQKLALTAAVGDVPDVIRQETPMRVSMFRSSLGRFPFLAPNASSKRPRERYFGVVLLRFD